MSAALLSVWYGIQHGIMPRCVCLLHILLPTGSGTGNWRHALPSCLTVCHSALTADCTYIVAVHTLQRRHAGLCLSRELLVSPRLFRRSHLVGNSFLLYVFGMWLRRESKQPLISTQDSLGPACMWLTSSQGVLHTIMDYMSEVFLLEL